MWQLIEECIVALNVMPIERIVRLKGRLRRCAKAWENARIYTVHHSFQPGWHYASPRRRRRRRRLCEEKKKKKAHQQTRTG
jgi:hypothetical protein